MDYLCLDSKEQSFFFFKCFFPSQTILFVEWFSAEWMIGDKDTFKKIQVLHMVLSMKTERTPMRHLIHTLGGNTFLCQTVILFKYFLCI